MEAGRQQDYNKAFPYLIRNWLSEMKIDLMFCIRKANPDCHNIKKKYLRSK